MAKWSWSKLQTARKCPLALHLEHVEKVPRKVPGFLNAGRANHAVLEEASRRCFLNGAPQPIEQIAQEMEIEFVEGAWRDAHEKIFGRMVDLIASAPIPQLGETLLLEKKFLVEESGCLEAEGTKTKEAFCSGLGDHIVLGPDRLVVWDWKTGWGSGGHDNIDQVILYAGMALAWMVDSGASTPATVDVAIKHSFVPRADQGVIMPAEAVNAKYRALLREMVSLNHILDSNERPEARFGDHCATCFVNASCPVYSERIKTPSVWDGDADAWAMRSILKAALADIEDHLKRRLHATPFLDVGTENPLRFNKSPMVGIDAGKAYPILREAGVSSATFLHSINLTKTNINKMVKDKDVREHVMLEASFVKGERLTMTTSPGEVDDDE